MPLHITPTLAREATALVVAGRLFAECPKCGNVRSMPEPEAYPVELVCHCGQAYTVNQKEG